MLQMYLSEFAQFNGKDISDYGIYEYPYFEAYWSDQSRHPYFIMHNNAIAGFCLVNMHTTEIDSGYSMAEFYILPEYRRQGLGKKAALEVFGLYEFNWEIKELKTNTRAISFWRNTIQEIAGSNYVETETFDSVVQTFVVKQSKLQNHLP